MRLVLKLTLAFVVVVCVVLAAHDSIRFRQDVEEFEAEQDLDHEHVGRALAGLVGELLHTNGEAGARRALATAANGSSDLVVRWVCGPSREQPLTGDCARLTGDQPLRTTAPGGSGTDRRITYVPIRGPDGAGGAIEVSEAAAREQAWVRARVRRLAGLATAVIATSTALAFVLGLWLVARPTRALVAKARAVGRGQFEDPLALPQRDELGQLADEMNAMCLHLKEARLRAEREAATRIEAEQQLRHADRLATLGRLAAGIAHELGTPLNVIDTRAALIAEDRAVGDEIRESARVIGGCTERITRIVRQLLVFARQRRPEPVRTDLRHLAAGTIDLLRPLANRKGVLLEGPPAGAPEPAMADEVLLQQAITNLLVNAIQATPSGGRVELALERGPDDERRLVVTDTGPGIPPGQVERIFDPFFTTKEPGEGTGLGLAVAWGIVEEHGGTIEVDSLVGRGTVMTLKLKGEAA